MTPGLKMYFSLEKVDEREWSIDEATEMFESSNSKKYWKRSFKEGVQVDEAIFRGHYREQSPEDVAFISRYDLTFLTPCWHQIRCKVWLHIQHLFIPSLHILRYFIC